MLFKVVYRSSFTYEVASIHNFSILQVLLHNFRGSRDFISDNKVSEVKSMSSLKSLVATPGKSQQALHSCGPQELGECFSAVLQLEKCT